MIIKILSRNDTLKIISDEKFILTWKYLSENTKHYTLIQEYGFVASWYQLYFDKYEPMMVLGYNEEDLIGILPLAIAYDTGCLSHAGADQAEYHGWICKKEYEEEFLVQALISIKKECKVKKWKWGWLPPKITISRFNRNLLSKKGIYINQVVSKSPVYNLENSEKINKIKRKKSIKNKIKQLERKGELKIERIQYNNNIKKLLENIIAQYGFRQLALFNSDPLGKEINKKICLSQMDLMPENIHFTVLWHGNELLACNFGLCTEDQVMLGLMSYDPVKGRYSPGTIFLLKLLEYIQKEGYKVLDLTPGGDSYKENFCNEHIDLIRPTICFNRYNQIKDRISTSLLQYMKKYFSTKDLVAIQCAIKKNISLMKKKVLEPKDTAFSYYIHNGKSEEKIPNSDFPMMHCQQYTDLLLYQQSNNILSLKELVYSSMKKFERGDRLYTLVSDKKLIAFVWLANSGKKHWRPALKDRINDTVNSLYIYDFYTSEKFKKNDIFQFCIQNILQDIQDEERSILYLVKPADIDVTTVNRIGFFES